MVVNMSGTAVMLCHGDMYIFLIELSMETFIIIIKIILI